MRIKIGSSTFGPAQLATCMVAIEREYGWSATIMRNHYQWAAIVGSHVGMPDTGPFNALCHAAAAAGIEIVMGK